MTEPIDILAIAANAIYHADATIQRARMMQCGPDAGELYAFGLSVRDLAERDMAAVRALILELSA